MFEDEKIGGWTPQQMMEYVRTNFNQDDFQNINRQISRKMEVNPTADSQVPVWSSSGNQWVPQPWTSYPQLTVKQSAAASANLTLTTTPTAVTGTTINVNGTTGNVFVALALVAVGITAISAGTLIRFRVNGTNITLDTSAQGLTEMNATKTREPYFVHNTFTVSGASPTVFIEGEKTAAAGTCTLNGGNNDTVLTIIRIQ